MRAVLMRELFVSARRAAVVITALGLTAVLTAFVLVWSPGVAVLAPMNLYEQTRLLYWVVLATTLPWTAARAASADRGDAFVLMTAFTGLRPSTMVGGKIIAMFTVMVTVSLTGLPGLLIAQQAAAVPAIVVLNDLLSLLGLALLVAVATTWTILVVPDSLSSWLTATAVTAVVLFTAAILVPETQTVGMLCALVGMAGAVWVCSWSNGSLRYLGRSDVE